MAGRRRARAKKKVYYWSDLGFTSDEDENAEVPEASTSKARSEQKAVAKPFSVRITKKGKLGMITEMPLDVLYEVSPSSSLQGLILCFRRQIFSFLAPRDLVRMSWTNKEFRRVLTSRSTRNIWRAALDSVDGLPPCPAHMNEIEYSTVLFHVACHVRPAHSY